MHGEPMKSALSILVMAAVYVLTFPAVALETHTAKPSRPMVYNAEPGWFHHYATPYRWLRDTRLRQAMDAYWNWFSQHVHKL